MFDLLWLSATCRPFTIFLKMCKDIFHSYFHKYPILVNQWSFNLNLFIIGGKIIVIIVLRSNVQLSKIKTFRR